MKARAARYVFVVVVALTGCAVSAIADDSRGAAMVLAEGGGAMAPPAFRDEISPLLRARIDSEVADTVARLQARGILIPPLLSQAATTPVLLDWPLRPTGLYTEPDYHAISDFVDLDATYPNHLLDYQCGTRTYDLSIGYNHPGVDILLWPYPWLLMDQGAIQVVSAAPGTLVGKIDGNDDRSCPNSHSPSWNAVYVQHADGTVAWYGHLRKNSVTAKTVGQPLAQGEYLGEVGSSGNSSGPHLHFELHSSSMPGYSIIEGHSGACNAVPSRYLNQRPYFDSRINRLATHSAVPDLNAGCPNPTQETPHFTSMFLPGEAVYFAAYYRDQQAGQPTQFRVLRPDHSVFATWTQAFGGPPGFYAASFWYRSYLLPNDAPNGAWTFEATFLGNTTTKAFFVGEFLFADGFEG